MTPEDKPAARDRPGLVEWLPAMVAAVVVPILWFALGAIDEPHAAMPAWATLLFAFGGRKAVVGVFVAGGWLSLCMALVVRWPRVGTTMILTTLMAVVVAVMRAAWLHLGGFSGAAAPALVGGVGWILLLVAALFLPTVWLRRKVFALVAVLGPVVAGVAAAGTARWGYLALSLAVLAFVVWIGTAPRRETSKPDEPG